MRISDWSSDVCSSDLKSAAMALDPINAANAINIAYRRTTTLRRHLCPLDLADELPPLSFGNARVEQFGADELASLFDAARLARNFPNQILDVKRLAQFHWLVVEEEIEIDPRHEEIGQAKSRERVCQ